MTGQEPQFIEVGTGIARRRIAYRRESRASQGKPGLLWLSGFKSDMASTKATALADYAADRGIDCVRFDYSGHGLSDGPFESGTIGRWLEEAEAVFRSAANGPQVIVGSSMGGHIALLLLKRLLATDLSEARRIAALILIAPAWDMTEELMWKRFPAEARRALETEGVYFEPSNYGEPYTITRALIEDGHHHLLAREPFDPGRPVLILQGLQDQDVPASHVRELKSFLKGGHVRLTEVPDGEHRLSRPQDLALLFQLIDEVAMSSPTDPPKPPAPDSPPDRA
jgi:pimeloyl-ACP methyl ester carboxylesterase